jgi:hypothetical protein
MGKRKYDYVVERVNEKGDVYSREYYTSLKDARAHFTKRDCIYKGLLGTAYYDGVGWRIDMEDRLEIITKANRS